MNFQIETDGFVCYNLSKKKGEKDMYNLKDLSLITGLTDRTLRNYLNAGILVGEKKGGAWSFTEEQIGAFLKNPYVKPAVKAKRNSILYDYLRVDLNEKNTACVILRLKEDCSKSVAEFFCDAVNKRQGLKMTFDHNNGENKVVLVGEEETVYDILVEYHSRKHS